MPLAVGIDEAGYGPLLGPLVVGATLWRVPPRLLDADCWDVLCTAVSRSPERDERRVPVGDSKQVYDRKRGLFTLERTVLAFAQAAGVPCGDAGSFLAALGFDGRAGPGCPWYDGRGGRLPLGGARSAFEGVAQHLAQTMHAAGLSCCGLRLDVLTEDAFNQRMRQTRNKASVVVEAVLRLIHWAGEHAGEQDLHVLVDRLGGRADYRDVLLRAFPDRHLHVVEVTDARSRYRLASQRTDWHVAFAVDGDRAHLPVALASMLAKYVRELLMTRFNDFWRRIEPGLKPTAGYYTDAQRFLKEIQPLLARASLAPEQFVRVR